MQNVDDYSKAPQTISEIRAHRDGLGSAWTPRDALVRMLRDIDNGIVAPDALVILYREPGATPQTHYTNFYIACANFHEAIGIVASGKYDMLKASDDG